MPTFLPGSPDLRPSPPIPPPQFLGTSLVLNLEEFPELNWLITYLATLTFLESERDRLTQAIQAIAEAGDVYRNCWIEPYLKTKRDKQYTYYQLRWLTGERKPSRQPKVKTKHLSHRAVGEVRAAIARGHQIDALEQQRQDIEVEIQRLKQRVQGTGKGLKHISSQNQFSTQFNHTHEVIYYER